MMRINDPVELLRRLCSRSGLGVATPVPHAAVSNGGPPKRAANASTDAYGADPRRRGTSETMSNGTILRYCRTCGRLAAWGYGASLDRAGVDRTGRWYCFEHRE